MKGSIDVKGELSIERPRPRGPSSCVPELIKMICPFKKEYCSDRCPSFHEPRGLDDGNEAKIEICSGTIIFDEFKDYRLNDPDWPRK